MGLLTIGTTTSYGRTTASQANLGTATTLGAKLRVSGAMILSGGGAGSVIIIVKSAGGTVRFQVISANTGGNTIVAVAGAAGAGAAQAIAASTAYNASEFYVIECRMGTGGNFCSVYSENRTQIATGSAGASAPTNSNAANGCVFIGNDANGTVGAVDGLALYSQAPPSSNASPAAGDTGILWAVLDDVAGQLVGGAEELDSLVGTASWGAGGEWPAPFEFDAVAADATPMQADAAAGMFVDLEHVAAVADLAPMQADAVTSVFAEAEHDVTVVDVSPMQADFVEALWIAPVSVEVGDVNPMQADAAAALASTLSTWGVVGDSLTDEYQADDDRGPPEVIAWWELLAGTARINAGPWGTRAEPRRSGYEYCWARSGSQIGGVIADQIGGLAAQIADGTVRYGVIGAPGSNDWFNPSLGELAMRVYLGDGTETDEDVPYTAIIEDWVDHYSGLMDTLEAAVETAGVGGGVVVLTLPDFALIPPALAILPDPTGRGYLSGVLADIHEGIEDYAEVLNLAAGYTRFAVEPIESVAQTYYPSADGTHLRMSGLLMRYDEEWEYDPETYDPRFFALAPTTGISHPGTVYSAQYARSFITAANRLTGVFIEPIPDSEILDVVGIDSVHTAASSDASPMQVDAASGFLAIAHEAQVADVTPMQSDSASGTWSLGQDAVVTDANPMQADEVAAEMGIGHEAVVSDANPGQVDSAQAAFVEPDHVASVADVTPAQVDAVDALFDTVIADALIADLTPVQVDVAEATQVVSDFSGSVADLTPMQLDAILGTMAAPSPVAVADLMPMQADAATALFDEHAPQPPYTADLVFSDRRATMTIEDA